jgi:hypothetical protein
MRNLGITGLSLLKYLIFLNVSERQEYPHLPAVQEKKLIYDANLLGGNLS